MSIFNMMVGGGGNGWETATGTSSNGSQTLQFSVSHTPREWLMFYTSGSGSINNTNYHVVVSAAKTDNYSANGWLRYLSSTGSYRIISNIDDITTSYSSGTFTLSLTSTNYYFGSKYGLSDAVLIYR